MALQPEVLSLHQGFTIASKQELIHVFRDRDQKKLILPDHLNFPATVSSYLTWSESSGVYTYLVFKLPNWDTPRGIAFKKIHHSGEPTGNLCNWCHAYGSSDEIGLMSVTLTSKTSASYLLCKDLSCVDKIHDQANRAGKNPHRHLIELYSKMEKLFDFLAE